VSTISVGILGLERLGASVGLALKRYNGDKGAKHQFQIVGMDLRGAVQSAAEKRGAQDGTARGFADAARNRDIVVLALPYSEVQSAYRDIANNLRPGAVVLDMSPLAEPSVKWAKAALPENAYMVGVTPILNPDLLFDVSNDVEHARADLFDRGAMLLMPSPDCAKEAVELAADLATILGATPHFMDAAEHDALAAATEGLPALLALAVFYTLQQGKMWGDGQRLTNPNFAALTHPLDDTHPDDLRDLLLNNRQNVVHHIDALMATLGSLREVLERGDRQGLEVALIDSAQAYQKWLDRRRRGRWEETPNDTKASSAIMSGLMGNYLAKRLQRGAGNEDEE
jgi:prephenate dehydrogenase